MRDDEGWHRERVALPGLDLDRVDGIGAVPDGAEIEHRGATVLMRPSVFLRLALPLARDRRPASAAYLRAAISGGRALAPAMLKVDAPDADVPGVEGHEGRHRMEAILDLLGDGHVPVHLTRPFRRAGDMGPDWLREVSGRLVDEAGTNVVEGPLFVAVRVGGRTHVLRDGDATVVSRPFHGPRLTRLQADALCLMAFEEPGFRFEEIPARLDAEGDLVAAGLAALGHEVDEEGIRRTLAGAVRARGLSGRVADALGPERLARHGAAVAVAPPGP